MKKEKFYIAVCIISFFGICAVKLNLRVFTYWIDWDAVLIALEVLLAVAAPFLVAIIFMFGVDFYKDNIKNKIFKRDKDNNNKAA